MPKLTMKQMLWLGKPLSWKKDWRSLSLRVDPHTTYPENCPSIIAAWDEDIRAVARLSLAPSACEGGIIVFQTPQSLCAAGASPEGFRLHYQVMGYRHDTFLPCPISQSHIWMGFSRMGARFAVSYSLDGNQFRQVDQGTLPGLAKSYSFGWYWSNPEDTPFEASVDTLAVTKL
ncbi:MAG: hypothetical protein SPL79_00525 [Sphaerochaetaceae bacterium]|nr:hypothetical protein [Spirochaetaceae bacterium]MDY6342763.1 hypothetical protein [Sphaerochaetaceae bacterium]